jgi:polysaccharide export outer membrane protein
MNSKWKSASVARAGMIGRTLLVLVLGIRCALPAPQVDAPSRAATTPAHPAEHADSGEQTLARQPWQTRNPRYQVRPGDVVEILFSPMSEFNQTISIQPDGYITLREIQDVYVQGKTMPEMAEAITSAYGSILQNPVITVVLKQFEQPHFIVGGRVEKPGKYELRADTTVSEAVLIAGSFTDKAKHSEVLLFRRSSNDWMEVRRIDLKAIYKGQVSEDVHLRPGDMIFVPQNRISKIKPFIPVWALSTYFPGRF